MQPRTFLDQMVADMLDRRRRRSAERPKPIRSAPRRRRPAPETKHTGGSKARQLLRRKHGRQPWQNGPRR